MRIYHYDHQGVYVGESPARPSPKEPGRYLIPALATDQPPPAGAEGLVPVWDGAAWALQPDFRGQAAYDPETGAERTITAPGPWPVGLAAAPRPGPTYDWDGAAWAESPAKVQAARRNEILARLDDIDRRAVRPLWTLAAGTATAEDEAVLAGLATEKEALRAELAGLAAGEE